MQALQTFEEALQEMKQVQPREEYGITAMNMGMIYFVKQQFDVAESFYKQALLNFEQFLPPLHKNVAAICTQLVITMKKRNLNPQERQYVQQLTDRAHQIALHHKQQVQEKKSGTTNVRSMFKLLQQKIKS